MKTQNHAVTRRTLPNGVRLIHIRTAQPISTVTIWFPFGSRQDPKGREGLAHLMEHLCLKTTPSLPSAIAVRDFQSQNGIYYNATTYAEKMRFVYEAESAQAHVMLAHVIESLTSFTIDPNLFATEKKVIRDERARKKQQLERMMHEWVCEGLFAESSIAHSGLGTDESVDAITLEELVDFTRVHISNAPKTFVICSPHNPDEFVLALSSPALSAKGKFVSVPAIKDKRSVLPLVRKQQEAPNVRIALSFETCSYETVRDMHALRFLARSYLCVTRASRLVSRLRGDMRLTYAVDGIVQSYTDTGSFTMQFSVPKAEVRAALAVCDEEIRALREGSVDVGLLEGGKNFMRYGVQRQMLDPLCVAEWHGVRELFGPRGESVEEYLEAISGLTPGDLQRVARTYFTPERRSIVLYGDAKDISTEGI